MSRAVMQQALEAAALFRSFKKSSHAFHDGRPLHEVTAELLEALAAPQPAQPAQKCECPSGAAMECMSLKNCRLNTAPPQRQPLTRKKIDEMDAEGAFLGNIYEITRAVEFEHDIKEQS